MRLRLGNRRSRQACKIQQAWFLNLARLPNSPRSSPLYGCRENITSKNLWIGYRKHAPVAWNLHISQEGRQMETFAVWF